MHLRFNGSERRGFDRRHSLNTGTRASNNASRRIRRGDPCCKRARQQYATWSRVNFTRKILRHVRLRVAIDPLLLHVRSLSRDCNKEPTNGTRGEETRVARLDPSTRANVPGNRFPIENVYVLNAPFSAYAERKRCHPCPNPLPPHPTSFHFARKKKNRDFLRVVRYSTALACSRWIFFRVSSSDSFYAPSQRRINHRRAGSIRVRYDNK